MREQIATVPVEQPSWSPAVDDSCKYLFNFSFRHCGVMLSGDLLYVFYTQAGEAPERIVCTLLDISADDWAAWTVVNTEPTDVLAPETSYEGADLQCTPSVRGQSLVPVNQLRDPYIFQEDGSAYLLYACAGENGLGLARMDVPGMAGAPRIRGRL
jgi:hypothetical protein